MARLKHVYETGQVAHIFFHRPKGLNSARNPQSNFSWNGNIFYSYSSTLAIALFDKKVLLLRAGTYSHTTATHQWLVRKSPPANWKIYAFDEWYIGNYGSFVPGDHLYQAFINQEVERVRKNKEQLRTGIKFFGDPELQETAKRTITEFCTDLKCKKFLKKGLNALKKVSWTEEELKEYKVKEWCSRHGITGSYKDKCSVYENQDLASEYIEKANARYKKAQEAKERREEAQKQEQIEKWYNHEINLLFRKVYRYRYSASERVYLRPVENDSTQIETSLMVKVPLVEAKALYRFFNSCINTNKEWRRNGEKFRIGLFQVDSIYKLADTHWYLLAGCHKIRDVEIEEFVTRFYPDWKLKTQ